MACVAVAHQLRETFHDPDPREAARGGPLPYPDPLLHSIRRLHVGSGCRRASPPRHDGMHTGEPAHAYWGTCGWISVGRVHVPIWHKRAGYILRPSTGWIGGGRTGCISRYILRPKNGPRSNLLLGKFTCIPVYREAGRGCVNATFMLNDQIQPQPSIKQTRQHGASPTRRTPPPHPRPLARACSRGPGAKPMGGRCRPLLTANPLLGAKPMSGRCRPLLTANPLLGAKPMSGRCLGASGSLSLLACACRSMPRRGAKAMETWFLGAEFSCLLVSPARCCLPPSLASRFVALTGTQM